MNAIDLKQTPADLADDVFYPDSDGEPMAETGIHVLAMIALIGALRMHFARRPDMYIIGNIFLYYEKGRPQSCKSPDVMVVKGVSSTPQRRSFKTWVEGAAPTVIFEITSKGTADEDVENKRELYERLGVNEYFLFDPLHEYLDQQVMGYRLVEGKYEPLVLTDGGLLSVELGMHLVPEGELLALFDARTGKRVPAPDDLGPLMEEAERNARAALEEAIQAHEEARIAHKEARQAHEQARQQKEQVRQAQEQARQAQEQARQEQKRADGLEQEVARLRALLPPANGTNQTNNAST
jgi:Uma2 family endonuclease